MLFETSIPYRITRNMEEPISRTFWFDAVFTCGAQSVQSLFVDHLKQLKINYIRVLMITRIMATVLITTFWNIFRNKRSKPAPN